MLHSERLDKLYEFIHKNKSASVNDLSEQFDVSTMTIRRDLKTLEEKGLIIRSHGGASIKEPIYKEREYREKKTINVQAKEEIAKAAFNHVSEGMTIFLDAGSTTYTLARLIMESHKKNIFIITNDIHIVKLLMHADNVRLFLLGGMLDKEVGNTLGNVTISNLNKLHGDLAFVGTSSITEDLQLFTPSDEKVFLKRAFINAADKKILISDKSKFDAKGLYHIGNITEFDGFISDVILNQKQIQLLKNGDCKYEKV